METMHSSGMRTVHCPPPCHAHPPHHTWPPAMHSPSPATHTPLPCMRPSCHVCPPCHARPMHRILDTPLWKHYLSASTVADGNYTLFHYRQSSDSVSEFKEGFLQEVPVRTSTSWGKRSTIDFHTILYAPFKAKHFLKNWKTIYCYS